MSLVPDYWVYFDLEGGALFPALWHVGVYWEPLDGHGEGDWLIYENVRLYDGEEYRIWFRGPLE